MLPSGRLRVRLCAPVAALAGCALMLACSRRSDPPKRHTAPWPAQPSASAVAREVARFRLEPSGQALFVLDAPKRKLRGRLRVARGELELDPADLRRLRGKIGMDLGSLIIDDPRDEPDRDESARAQSWLKLGSSVPEAERERLRWAEFRIVRVVEASAADTLRARKLPAGDPLRLPPAPGRSTAGTRPPAAGASAGLAEEEAIPGEARRAELTLEGTLELLGYRVERRVQVALVMEWSAPKQEGAAPERLALTTTRPFSIFLAEHEIVPRDALGTLLSAELRRIGSDVGREAKVTVSFVARRAE